MGSDVDQVIHSYTTLFACFKCRYNASCVGGRRLVAQPSECLVADIVDTIFYFSIHITNKFFKLLYLFLNTDPLQAELELFDR